MTLTPLLVPPEWRRLIERRSPAEWSDAVDEEIPIPTEFLKVAAYFIFVERGGSDGLDRSDWFDAEHSLRERFRDYAAALVDEFEEKPLDDWKSADVAELPESTGDVGLSQDSVFTFEPTIRNCTETESFGRVEKMGRRVRFREASAVDSEVRESVRELSGYRDAMADAYAKAAQGVPREGRFAAVLVQTGEVIAWADGLDALEKAVAASVFADRPWRICDAPQPLDAPALTREELRKLMSDEEERCS